MEQEDIRRLISNFLANEITDSGIDQLKEWLAESPENRHIFDIENELWQKTTLKNSSAVFDPACAWKEMKGRIPGMSGSTSGTVILSRRSLALLVAAASVTLLMAIGGVSLWISGKMEQREIMAANTIFRTSEGEKADIYLPDSSRITINSGSEIEYGAGYNIRERIVRLSGEAYFDVHTDPDKPFIVEAGREMTVSATGTKFNIYSYPDENRIETTLVDGKVSVKVGDKDPVEITPGQQVVYFPVRKEAIVKNVVPETYTSWKENKLRFIDTPFEEVLRKLGRRYNVVFEVRNKDLLELRYTATFIDESIEEVMQMLKTISPISYKIYNRTTVNDSRYLKPKIIVSKRIQ
jgi:ferric-dicitrate binding protein FerR (iron transport regulator)